MVAGGRERGGGGGWAVEPSSALTGRFRETSENGESQVGRAGGFRPRTATVRRVTKGLAQKPGGADTSPPGGGRSGLVFTVTDGNIPEV